LAISSERQFPGRLNCSIKAAAIPTRSRNQRATRPAISMRPRTYIRPIMTRSTAQDRPSSARCKTQTARL
jgi:hypothetical protein